MELWSEISIVESQDQYSNPFKTLLRGRAAAYRPPPITFTSQSSTLLTPTSSLFTLPRSTFPTFAISTWDNGRRASPIVCQHLLLQQTAVFVEATARLCSPSKVSPRGQPSDVARYVKSVGRRLWREIFIFVITSQEDCLAKALLYSLVTLI